MKKTTALACLFLCLIPALVKAEEPDLLKPEYGLKPPAEEESWRDRILSDVTVNDEELVRIVGQGFEMPIPAGLPAMGKLELAASKIKLWDEADKGITNNGSCFQKITLSTIGNR